MTDCTLVGDRRLGYGVCCAVERRQRGAEFTVAIPGHGCKEGDNQAKHFPLLLKRRGGDSRFFSFILVGLGGGFAGAW